MPIDSYQSSYEWGQATIANGETESGSIQTHGTNIIGFYVPTTFSGTALTFKINVGGAYKVVTGVSMVVTADQFNPIALVDSVKLGPDFKIVSNASESGDQVIDYLVRLI